MNLKNIHDYYSREDVQKALLGFGKDREVVGVFKNGNFGSRPNTILYTQDIVEMVRSGIVEFHSSIEHWSQPMALRQDNYNELRNGWDIVLDLDCKATEHGKEAARALCWGLEKHGIKSYSVKFTGGKGFHIGIPWQSVPESINYKPSAGLFPDVPRNIGLYLREYIREKFEKLLLKRWNPEDLAKQVGKPLGKIITETGIDPYQIVDIDPILISPRHLFRMPYSLNKKTWLVSIPIKPADIESFEREQARPEKVKKLMGFLDGAEAGEAELLIAETLDWMHASRAAEDKGRRMKMAEIQSPVTPEYFPPCVQNILKGLADGKKRSIFVLINFLSSLKWKYEDIENLMLEWNRKNSPPVRENYIRGQVRWHSSRNQPKPPPACNKDGWYGDFGVCQPDNMCGGQEKTIKNPVRYPLKKMGIGRSQQDKKAGSKKPRRKPSQEEDVAPEGY
jgi:hypothetical protein